MAFFNAIYSADPAAFDVVGVEGGNAEQIETDLLAAIAGAGPDLLVDVVLGGAGAGPRWHAYACMADAAGAPAIAKANVRVAAATAGNPAEAQLKATQKLNAMAPTNVVRVVVAGAGLGPSYMALAIGEV